MDFWKSVERGIRRAFMGDDWRIHAVNPAPLINFNPKGMTKLEILELVKKDFDCVSFPVRMRAQTPNGNRSFSSNIDAIDDNAVCLGKHLALTRPRKGQMHFNFPSPDA